MSAYVVNNRTINTIVAGIKNAVECVDRWNDFTLDANLIFKNSTSDYKVLGKLLFSMNIESVSQRYGIDEEFRKLDYKYQEVVIPSPIQFLKSIHCLEYQCYEGNIPDTKLYKILNKIGNKLAQFIVCRLPAYDRAIWG